VVPPRVGRGATGPLSATTTFFSPKKPQATYGIFISNARGPGTVSDSYASNMNDASFYVGACHPCNATLERVHGQHSNLGYSGTNSSKVLIENSEFDDNTTGITTNSQNNDDAPSPQLGSTFSKNFIHDNNNPNVASHPGSLRAVGVGVIVAGGLNNEVLGNRIEHQGGWGIAFAPYADRETPPKVSHCEGGAYIDNPFGTGKVCYYNDSGNEAAQNTLKDNGFFGNPTNGDLAEVSGEANPGNCWHDNKRSDGSAPSSQPQDLQTAHAQCGIDNQGDNIFSPLADQLLCDTELLSTCKKDATHDYPRTTKVTVRKLPALKSMPSPCKGVPSNPWCR